MNFIFSVLFFIFAPVLFIGSIISFMVVINFVVCFIMGQRLKKGFKKPKKKSIIRRIFWDFPARIVDDAFNRDPFEFEEYGLHMFCGRQGSGKTISLVQLLIEMKKKYPKVKIATNMFYKNEDGIVDHWKSIVNQNNGTNGQIIVIDEIQTWFCSNQSKSFPPEMITEISQQRKQRKMIVGTAQVFSRIAKPIREQTTYVYCPHTFMGCLTIVRVSRPEFWNDEKQKFEKYIRNYFFVHDDVIRNSFDTFLKIEKYKKFEEKPSIHNRES